MPPTLSVERPLYMSARGFQKLCAQGPCACVYTWCYCEIPFRLNNACCVKECKVGVHLIKDHANFKKGRCSRVYSFSLRANFHQYIFSAHALTQHAMFERKGKLAVSVFVCTCAWAYACMCVLEKKRVGNAVYWLGITMAWSCMCVCKRLCVCTCTCTCMCMYMYVYA